MEFHFISRSVKKEAPFSLFYLKSIIGGSKRVAKDAHHPLSPIFQFMQLSGKMAKMIGLVPQFWSWCLPLEILDPPLLIHIYYSISILVPCE